MKFKTLITVALISSSLLWAGDKRIIDLNFDLKKGAELEVKLEGASIEVEGHSGRTLNFFAKIEGRSSFVENYEFDFDESGSDLEIKGKLNGRNWGWGQHGSVRVRMQVPQDLLVSIQTSGGDVRARDMTEKIELRTSGGDVMVRDVLGVVVHTSGGGIQLVNNKGQCHLSTSGGNIFVENQVGDMAARTSGGNVRLTGVDGQIVAKTSGGDIRIELDGDNHGIDARTSGGDVYIYAKGDVGAELSARTSGGRVSVDLPMRVLQKRDETMLNAIVNDGGPEMVLRSSGGNIKVRNL